MCPTSWPLNTSRPADGSTRPRIMRARVVLPLPLSPAMVRISCWFDDKVRLARSTATTLSELNPRLELKTRVRLSTRSNASGADNMRLRSCRHRADEMTRHPVAGADFLERRRRCLANVHGVRAARMKAAARWRVIERGRPPRDADSLGTLVESWQRLDEVLRVRVQRLLEQRERVGLLHHLPGVQHHHAVGQVGVHAHV